jgi:UDP-N-acetyl-D-glucosamine dehydrogenase
VEDLRESPSLKLMQLLMEHGAALDYNDPHCPEIPRMRHYDYSHMRSVPLSPESIASYDCVLIATDHGTYDYPAIVASAQLVIDTRNATKNVTGGREKIIRC